MAFERALERRLSLVRDLAKCSGVEWDLESVSLLDLE